jgi:hypothetical protein
MTASLSKLDNFWVVNSIIQLNRITPDNLTTHKSYFRTTYKFKMRASQSKLDNFWVVNSIIQLNRITPDNLATHKMYKFKMRASQSKLDNFWVVNSIIQLNRITPHVLINLKSLMLTNLKKNFKFNLITLNNFITFRINLNN